MPDSLQYRINLEGIETLDTKNINISTSSASLAYNEIKQSENSPRLHKMELGEIMVVAVILAAWLAAIALFLHKWRRLRITPPREPRFKHNPKNLDAVTICKRSNDSVIYKSYTKQITTTMQARQTKLERMSTMPNIKIPVLVTPPGTEARAPVASVTNLAPETSESPTRIQRKESILMSNVRRPSPLSRAKEKEHSNSMTDTRL